MITIRANGRELPAAEGANLLEVLQSADIRIPALCFHPALKSATGICRVCTVEVTQPGKAPEAKRAAWLKKKTCGPSPSATR